MATPPTGLNRPGKASASSAQMEETTLCPRCGERNALHLRFCNNCGYQQPGGVDSAERGESGSASDLPGPSAPPAMVSTPQNDHRASSGMAGGESCWRCRETGDLGADFCKYCGAAYSDAPGGGTSKSSEGSQTPANAAQPGTQETKSPADMALVSILKDGSDGRRYELRDEQTDLGGSEGHLILDDDPYLSPRHARLVRRGDRVLLQDLHSLNGVYLRIRHPQDLQDGDMILLGQQVVRFELLAEMELPLGPAMQDGVMIFGTPDVSRIARLVHYTTEGLTRDIHYLYRDETVIGREQGDLVFTDDPFMSRRHACITLDRTTRRFVLRDLGSSNGTTLRLRGETELNHDDHFRVGRHLFRFEKTKSGSGGGAKR